MSFLMRFILQAQQSFLGQASRQPNSRVLLATTVGAGSPCSTNDTCSFSTRDGPEQLCPADPATSKGTCPFIAAGDPCQPTDLCASSATDSVPCPAATPDSPTPECPYLPSDATCTALAGPCSGNQQCNGQLKNPYIDASPQSIGLQDEQDSTVGVCITPVAAGLPCKAGTDMCTAYSDFAGMYCTASKCLLARPGADCKPGSDMCSDGGSGSLSCPGPADQDQGTCTPVATDGTCLAGDECTSPQICTGVGTTPGKCVTPVSAGLACKQADGATAADTCVVTTVNYKTQDEFRLASACSAATCPLATAGSVCSSGDVCSDGTAHGSACPQNTPSPVCQSLTAGSKCFANDKCLQGANGVPQICKATGTQSGVCTEVVSAGAACTKNVDLCSPDGAVCSGATCPPVFAGGNCVANGRQCM
ncbi:hypothetical protein ABBQ32_005337 [Trebouxia sp. C0010 RCD-2024]